LLRIFLSVFVWDHILGGTFPLETRTYRIIIKKKIQKISCAKEVIIVVPGEF
jgi:hypothetical protein